MLSMCLCEKNRKGRRQEIRRAVSVTVQSVTPGATVVASLADSSGGQAVWRTSQATTMALSTRQGLGILYKGLGGLG